MTTLEQDYEDWGCCAVRDCANALSARYDTGRVCLYHYDAEYTPCGCCDIPCDPEQFVTVIVPGGEMSYCPVCLASAQLAREVAQCRECERWYHDDMDIIHGGVCDAYEERRDEAMSCDPELVGAA